MRIRPISGFEGGSKLWRKKDVPAFDELVGPPVSHKDILDSFGNVLAIYPDMPFDMRCLWGEGDAVFIVRDPPTAHVGVGEFGWGSCPANDALHACCDRIDVVNLRNKIGEGILWFPDWETAIEYISEHLNARWSRKLWAELLEAL